MTPQAFPTGYEIPVVAWVVNEQGRPVRASGWIEADGQKPILGIAVTGNLTVSATGALTIGAGTVVRLSPGVNIYSPLIRRWAHSVTGCQSRHVSTRTGSAVALAK